MSKVVYVYLENGNINKTEYLDTVCVNVDSIIGNDKKLHGNYISLFNEISNHLEHDVDSIIIDQNVFQSIFRLFELAVYYRLMKGKFWDLPIFIYCESSNPKKIYELIKSDQTNIVNTARFEIINKSDFNIDELSKKPSFLQSLNIKTNESLKWGSFVDTIEIKEKTTDNHTIANEWAIYRWAKIIGASDDDIQKITKKVEENIYFKYLQAIHPIKESDTFSNEELQIKIEAKSKLKPKVLFIDDEADKGWYEIFCKILFDINEFDFDYLGDVLKDKTQEEIINESIIKVKEGTDIVILDFRIHKEDFIENDINKITGLKLLKAIKEINPGIQVIIFSATNKVWSLQALQKAGADGFIVKEAPENSVDENFTKKSIISFKETIKTAVKRLFLKSIWYEIKSLREINSDYNYQLDIGFKLMSDSIDSEKYLNYAYLQLFLIIEEFISSETIFIKNSEGLNFIKIKETELLVFENIEKTSRNTYKFKSAITFSSGNYKRKEGVISRPLDTNTIVSALLIFRYGLETSGEKNWTKVYKVRNTKAAHPEIGIVTTKELKQLIDFLKFILDDSNINLKNIEYVLEEPKLNDQINKLIKKYN